MPKDENITSQLDNKCQLDQWILRKWSQQHMALIPSCKYTPTEPLIWQEKTMSLNASTCTMAFLFDNSDKRCETQTSLLSTKFMQKPADEFKFPTSTSTKINSCFSPATLLMVASQKGRVQGLLALWKSCRSFQDSIQGSWESWFE